MSSPAPSWRSRTRWAVHHPRTAMALKAAVAVGLSWVIALQVPVVGQDYTYYAPLGAVVTMYPTVAGSAREAARSVAAIALGAALALVAEVTIGHGAAVVAAVVGVAVLLGGLRWLGSQRTYVPIAALFVLVIGQGHELRYAAAYGGLFLIGALTTVALNAAFPSLPVYPVDESLARLRTALAAHLQYLADRFSGAHGDEPLSVHGPGRPSLTDPTSRARDAVRQMREGTRGNLRARRVPDAVQVRVDTFRALERVVLLVDDLYDLLLEGPWGQDALAMPESVRQPIGRALGEVAGAVEDPEGDDARRRRAAVDAAVTELTATMRERQADSDKDAEALLIGTLSTTLRRCVAVLAPQDTLASSPTR